MSADLRWINCRVKHRYGQLKSKPSWTETNRKPRIQQSCAVFEIIQNVFNSVNNELFCFRAFAFKNDTNAMVNYHYKPRKCFL